MSLATSSLGKIVPRNNCSKQQLFLSTIIPPFLYKWSFTKRTVLWMTKIKETEEHGSLQMISRMIWHPPCSSISLQMVICKEHSSLYNQNQGDGGAGIFANDHLEDPASTAPSQMVVCKEVCSSYDQNQRDGGAWIIANDHLDDPAQSVLLYSFANGHLQRGRSSG